MKIVLNQKELLDFNALSAHLQKFLFNKACNFSGYLTSQQIKFISEDGSVIELKQLTKERKQ